VCASAHIFGAFKLLTLWPIFVKLGTSFTTVEDTWSQYFWFPTSVLTIWRSQILALRERR